MSSSVLEQTKQDPDNQYKSFSELVKGLMQDKKMTAADLSRASGLSKTTISRVLRDTNDKGQTYRPTDGIVAAIGLALGQGLDGWEKLLFAAFPERMIWRDAYLHKLSVADTNDLLYEEGLPLLGNSKLE